MTTDNATAFTGRWVGRVEYNGKPLVCKDPSCSQRWFVSEENLEGHCECHETEFWVSPGGLVTVSLGSV